MAHFGLGNRSVSAKEAGEVYKHSQFLVGSLNSRDEAGAGLDHAENDMEEVEEQGDAEQPSTSKLAVPVCVCAVVARGAAARLCPHCRGA